MREALYRYRATFGARWRSYVALAVLVAVLGGVAMGAVAGARRTQSSFTAYLRSTNPSDLQVLTAYGGITSTSYSASVEAAIARLPHVRAEADVIGFDPNLQVLQSIPPAARAMFPADAPPTVEGSPNGEFLSIDRVSLLRGRLFDPARTDEMVMTTRAAAEAGLRLGSTLRIGFFSNAQEQSSTFVGYPTNQPAVAVTLKLVGIIETSDQVVQDDDAALSSQSAILTPALTRQLLGCCAGYTYASLRLQNGPEHETTVLAGVRRLAPDVAQLLGSRTNGPVIAKAERAIRPEAIAFGLFGLLAAFAGLLIGRQAAVRLVRRNDEDAMVLRALGAGPATTLADGLIGVAAAIVAGAVAASALATAVSPLFPVGPVRPLLAGPGVSFDWTVLGAGAAALVVLLVSASLLAAYRGAPQRAARHVVIAQFADVGRLVSVAGMPPTAVTGVRAALGSGLGRDTSGIRSALAGAVLAVVVVTSALTFGSSLRFLVSRPPLYGWNWDYALLSGFAGQEDLPAAQTASLLDHDPLVARWSGVNFTGVAVDGQRVPALATAADQAVAPPVLSGHGLQAADQIVLGPATLAALHKHVGDVVRVTTGVKVPVTLRIVGTATLPTIGGKSALEMGTGAVMDSSLFGATALNPQENSIGGPEAVLIVVRPGVGAAAAEQSLRAISNEINARDSEQPAGGVVSVLRPAEIVDYGSVGSTPILLATVLAAGAVAALGLILLDSVRRRRRELAVLKTIGFTPRQLALSVAWQSSVSALVGVVAGVPLGVALGRWLWTLFARGISAVPHPDVPVLELVVVAAGAFVFANVIALPSARLAARAPTAQLLRSE